MFNNTILGKVKDLHNKKKVHIWYICGSSAKPIALCGHTFNVLVLLVYYQVFVANPNKTQPILDILLKNQTKLIEFLSKFQNDRTEDEQFNDEKTYLVKQIRDLKRPAPQEAWGVEQRWGEEPSGPCLNNTHTMSA